MGGENCAFLFKIDKKKGEMRLQRRAIPKKAAVPEEATAPEEASAEEVLAGSYHHASPSPATSPHLQGFTASDEASVGEILVECYHSAQGYVEGMRRKSLPEVITQHRPTHKDSQHQMKPLQRKSLPEVVTMPHPHSIGCTHRPNTPLQVQRVDRMPRCKFNAPAECLQPLSTDLRFSKVSVKPSRV
ncbi:unnamed protein product [Victoria cruziana]